MRNSLIEMIVTPLTAQRIPVGNRCKFELMIFGNRNQWMKLLSSDTRHSLTRDTAQPVIVLPDHKEVIRDVG